MQIAASDIDADAAKVVQRLRRFDHAAYLVGGCVRDLLLGRKPKDFDVVTSATPNDIKRLFRNCRIIGRRFRLAHIFFGPKIIETSTFRANPRELEDDDSESDDAESGDLLIRRDNVFGTPEQDARRRDFTINGLFYDIETGKVIDHVDGMKDLEARVVRTIGDPDIRFREDPIRILRAVKFAARCDLTIEPETYRRMMEHRQEIAKCAQARVSEEFYRLLRAGASKRSMELLVETDMLAILAPELARGLAGEAENEEAVVRRARLWGYLAALDRSSSRRPVPPSNALLLAVLLLPPLRDSLDPDSRGVRDIGQLVSQSIAPALEHLRASRRDSEVARQILLAIRLILPSKNPNRKRQRPPGLRDILDDALRLAEIVSDAEATDPSIAGRPIPAEAAAGETLDDEALEAAINASVIESMEPIDRRPRRHGRGEGRGEGGRGEGGRGEGGPRPPHPSHPPHPVSAEPAPLAMDLNSLAAAARSLVLPDLRPAFLGTGSFGGPWNTRQD